MYWTARTVGCSWCVDFGAMLIRLDGLDVERLKDIDDYATSPLYTDDERAAIAYADAMTTDPHPSPTSRWPICAGRFGDAGVIELTYQIGVENMRARMNTALGITEQGFNSGDACRVPWAPIRALARQAVNAVNLSGLAISQIAQTLPSRTVSAWMCGCISGQSPSVSAPRGVQPELAVDAEPAGSTSNKLRPVTRAPVRG